MVTKGFPMQEGSAHFTVFGEKMSSFLGGTPTFEVKYGGVG